VGEALAMAEAAMDYLNGAGGDALDGASAGTVLESMGAISAKFAAARAAILSKFDAARGHDADGYGSSASWLAARNKVTRRDANTEVRLMRQLRGHPVLADALARTDISQSWASQMADWTRKLPREWRDVVDKILVDNAASGVDLTDLAVIAQAAYERWRQEQGPDDDPDDGFEDRFLKLGTTIDNAGRVAGSLTPECAAALQAVLESLGKKHGPQDDRTEPQRFHDALQLACELLIRAKMVPERAGADTRVDAVVSLAELLAMDGASALQDAWLAPLLADPGAPGRPAHLAALAGRPGYLAGKDAEAIACDAIVAPVVTGQPDLTVVDTMIAMVLAYLDGTGPVSYPHRDRPRTDESPGRAVGRDPATAAAQSLSPEAWRALRYAMARLAVQLVSGPGGLACALRRGLLGAPYNSRSVALDIGYSATIPAAIRRAVQLRARHCEWPGCDKPLAWCDIHHLTHKRDGGPTSVTDCAALCQFHHDVCIHRRGWRLVLHPDASTTAYGPRGQVLHSHGPPSSTGPPDGQAA
jgi:hypothetical protein